MQFEVPQFIEVESKIFGPFTWKQFLYIGSGIGAVIITFKIHILLLVLLGIPVAILCGALAFYPVNRRPFSYFLESIFNYLLNNKLYLWKQKDIAVHKYQFTPKNIPNQPLPPISSHRGGKNISSLARRLELESLQKKES